MTFRVNVSDIKGSSSTKYIGTITRLETSLVINLRCGMPQKSEKLIYTGGGGTQIHACAGECDMSGLISRKKKKKEVFLWVGRERG